MVRSKVKFESIVESQLPEFVREEYPLLTSFLQQYYKSQEYTGSSYDLLQWIDQYLKIDEVTDLPLDVPLLRDLQPFDDEIFANTSTLRRYPEKNGLIKINDEIIYYDYIEGTTFKGCIRGFSGVTSYKNTNKTDELEFSTSEADFHSAGSNITCLSTLFLKEFLLKLKRQFIPGFDNKNFSSDLNQNIFIKQSRDFYSSKGTDDSFKILFSALFGDQVEIIKPRDNLFIPSNAGYRITNDIVVEPISGNPLDILNQTIYQDEYADYGIKQAYASVSDVEKVFVGGKEFYKISYDADFNKDISVNIGSLYGEFSIHPKTRVIDEVQSGSDIIYVDSTIGFPESGELVVNSIDGELTLSYSGKTVNEFLNVNGISSRINSNQEIRLNVFAYAYSNKDREEVIRFRVGGVIGDFNYSGNEYLVSKNDTVQIKSLGILAQDNIKASEWIYNVANHFKIKSLTQQSTTSGYQYIAETFVKNNFLLNDILNIIVGGSVVGTCRISSINSKTQFAVTEFNGISLPLNLNLEYTFERQILRGTSSKYTLVNPRVANVQNAYSKFNKDVLVASSSIPNYNLDLTPNDKKFSINGSFSGSQVISLIPPTNPIDWDHGLYTGDIVFYEHGRITQTVINPDTLQEFSFSTTNSFDGLNEGAYYVTRVDRERIRLSRNQNDLFNKNYISISGIVTDNKLSYYDFRQSDLSSQNIVRKIESPENTGNSYKTEPGTTGILINGVEILNYKSTDFVSFGKIEDLEVVAPGEDYDIINPPVLEIVDESGKNAAGVCAIRGGLKEIQIIDPGFAYTEVPYVSVTGGNGYGASALVSTAKTSHSVSFDNSIFSNLIGTYTIGFTTYHKFADNELVTYITDGQKGISGLTTEANYYVSVEDSYTVKLHRTFDDSSSGINTVVLGSRGIGVHKLKSVEDKQYISKIRVVDSGEGYENKKRYVTNVGINTAFELFQIKNHGYETGETVRYTTTGTPIGGLENNKDYLVKKVDEDRFKICNIGIGNTLFTNFLDRNEFVGISSFGSGEHYFNYPPIEVSIVGNIGISTRSNEDYSAKIQPIFQGSVTSVQVTNSGVGYGSSEIINYDRQPTFNFNSGSGAEVTPIISNGKIVDVIVNRPGSGYVSPPELIVSGTGVNYELIPIIKNGSLESVKIMSPGFGFQEKARITVSPYGKGAKLRAEIQKWNINLFEKNINIITEDDGILRRYNSTDRGIQYCHLYAPRKLREMIFAISPEDRQDPKKYGVYDLIISNLTNGETTTKYHSPIIGWAYDGNPIYGPNGYSNPDGQGGNVRPMRSGYIPLLKSSDEGRPPQSIFPEGFFIEDYFFAGNGDLDEHNGRFCVTPDYPNGTYAYFATIDSGLPQSSGPFARYKIPKFPYLIGDSFKSKPNEFNFLLTSEQDYIDKNSNEWFRVVDDYNLGKDNGGYSYLYNPNDYKKQTVDVVNELYGGIESIDIISGGDGYKVNDELVFNNENIDGSGAVARVSKVGGKNIDLISLQKISIDNAEIVSSFSSRNVLVYSSDPHGLEDNDIVSISGVSTEYSNIYKSYNVGVKSEFYIINSGIGSTSITGLTTYFYVSGNLNPEVIRENDVLLVGSEKLKVLNVDSINSRLRVLREYNSPVGSGSSYSVGTLIYEIPRKISVPLSSKIQRSFRSNREYYFDPSESVGLGTTSGKTLITFSVPPLGIGMTQISVPTNSIYIPDHKLSTNDYLTYNSNSGIGISVYDSYTGIGTILSDGQNLYAISLSKDFIGLSTSKVGLGTTGNYIGIGTLSSLLSFVNVGSGLYHSFKTNYETVKCSLTKREVTVSTATTHGLFVNDMVEMSILPKIQEEIIVKYNDSNRRLVFNPVGFASTSVDATNDLINIQSHGFKTGDKVIYTTGSETNFLQNNERYFVYVYDSDNISLCSSKFESLSNSPSFVGLGTTVSGELSKINPPINGYKNNTIKFNLSDPSLSYFRTSQRYPAFKLRLYKDLNFSDEFLSTEETELFEFQDSNGNVGIDTNASATLFLSDKIPEVLYYKLDTINNDIISDVKKQIEIDDEVSGYNSIYVLDSIYSGNKVITGIASTSFKYQLTKDPERNSYNGNNSSIEYITDSPRAYGPIKDVKVYEGGKYKELPEIISVTSSSGVGFILNSSSQSVGKIGKVKINDIGYDYPSDLTMRPVSNIPEIIYIEPLSSFDYIEVTYSGKNYISSPDLIVLDGFTNKIVNDVVLSYDLGEPNVRVIQNSYGFYNTTPRIIPINNSNGVGINSVSYNPTTKDVTIGFATGFSDEFPFSVGDKVLIENINVGITTTDGFGGNIFVKDGKGYNSSDYGYKLFEITQVNESLGGNVGSIVYNLSDVLNNGETPGTYSPRRSYGRAIPEKYFPTFNISLKKNDYLIGEEVQTEDGKFGVVEYWNNNIDLLKVSTNSEFLENTIVSGLTSKTKGVIYKKINFDSSFSVKPFSRVEKGWKNEFGILNENTQRIHDNDYYQYFSYSIKSKTPYDNWEDSVSSLNHTAGFKKFSDLSIESTIENPKSIFVEDFVEIVVDVVGEANINCFYNFDLVSERAITIGNKNLSNEIIFNSRILSDYFESIGNRVLTIDDLSPQFNSEPRPDNFAVVSSFNSQYRANKYFVYVKDSRYSLVREADIVTLLHNDVDAYIGQYGKVFTHWDLGSYDFRIFGTEAQLLFYPITYKINDYNISYVAFGLNDTLTSIGSTSFGDIVKLETTNTVIPSGSLSGVGVNIVSIGASYRSSKILLSISENDGSYYELNELNVIHDGSSTYSTEYGQITTENRTPSSGTGIGTYITYISGSNIKVDLVPYENLTTSFTVNSIRVSIADSSASGIETSQSINVARIKSTRTGISSSPTPTASTIASYDNEYDATYFILGIEDSTNNQYQISEVVAVSNPEDAFITIYGTVSTDSPIGTIGIATSPTSTNLLFTPNADTDVEVTVFQKSLKLSGVTTSSNLYDLNNGRVFSNFSEYYGTENSLIREFNLTHRQRNIFERNFDGSDNSIVDVSTDVIKIPDHFFVTGEKVIYGNGTSQSTSNSISIASTTVPGIGLTDRLPSEVYVVKLDESTLRLSPTAEDSLKEIPVVFDLTGVGVGTGHTLTSVNQNAKAIIAIDNFIQSPVLKSDISVGLSTDLDVFNTRVSFSGITSFFGGDLVQIDNEIMRIRSVGFGSTNAVLVYRAWMGTSAEPHSIGSTITKITGNYNIIGNKLHFVTAPYGNTPISTSTNPPDSVDWIGISTSSSFQGRVFLRNGFTGSNEETYSKNYIFDDISEQFNGLETDFTLTSDFGNVSGFSTDNAVVLINGVFQIPQGIQGETENYSLTENTGITSISFTGTATSVSYDINNASIPVGGVIISVGSTSGFGYQPLVSAGATAHVSIAGTIESISIGNSGSGYRSGIQTVVNVGVKTLSLGTPNIEFIGTAAISGGHIVSIAITNPGSGYTSTNPPEVVIDAPLPYADIPLIYSAASPSGVGTQATVNVTVGQGSSVIDFELKNLGYGYGQGQILTIGIGGDVGIPTDTTKPFEEFQITVDETDKDSFSAWSIGQLELLDSFDDQFDGVTRSFNLRLNNTPISIIASKGSLVDIKSTLLVFLNEVLQDPTKGAYTFNGGSSITFSEAPDNDDKCKILFYKGTGEIDVIFRDVEETIKVGDRVQINSSRLLNQNVSLQQDERVVTGINTVDSINTNTYGGLGITTDSTILRPLQWCKQTTDLIIENRYVYKDRIQYEASIYPNTVLINQVSSGSTVLYVENVKPLFNAFNENNNTQLVNKIDIISQDVKVSCTATAVVSTAGTISSITITNPGIGYISNPNIVIQSPNGVGSAATATSVISSGSVQSINITNPGSGYTSTNPPSVLIDSPNFVEETRNVHSYNGDNGIIVGFGISFIGSSNNAVFDFYIPENYPIRDSDIVQSPSYISGITTGDYFVVSNSNVAAAVTSVRNDSTLIGYGGTFLDNVYQVYDYELVNRVVGTGLTTIKRVYAKIESYTQYAFDSTAYTFDSTLLTFDTYLTGVSTSVTGIQTSNYFGNFSWGKIYMNSELQNNYQSYVTNGVLGIDTSAFIRRSNPLKYSDYTI